MGTSKNDGKTANRTQITLMVNQTAKERWNEYVEENSTYTSRSELIRHAVEKEINDTGGTEATDGQALADIKDELREVSMQIKDLKTTIDAVAERTSQTPEHIKKLQNEIFRYLPTRDELMDYQQALTEAGENIREAHVGPEKSQSGRVEDIADRLDANESDVRAALSQLQEDTKRVHSMEISGEDRFFKEV